MTKHPTLTVVLAPNGIDCQVLLDGVDVSRGLTGIAIEANVHERTRVTLDVFAGVELVGEAGELLRGLARVGPPPPFAIAPVVAPPGAVIVLRAAGLMTQEARNHIGAQLAEVFPNRRILVLDAGMDLSVLIEQKP